MVARCCAAAQRNGVLPGMTLAHARALCRGRLLVAPLRPGQDRQALHRLAAWATRFAPMVEPDDDHDRNDDNPQAASFPMPGLLADITGCERLYHGEENLLQCLLAAVRTLGLAARIASAPTVGGAWAAARFSPKDLTIVPEGQLRQTLAQLPVRGLRISERTVATLWEVGVETIGELMRLPPATLPVRFGEKLPLRLHQALGEAMEIIDPVRPDTPVEVTQLFAGPVSQWETIELATRLLIERLCERLHQRESGARRIGATLERSDCDPAAFELVVSRFSRDAKHLWWLLRPKLEKVHLGFGVESITLTALDVGRLAHEPIEHPAFGTMHRDANLKRDFAQAIDILTNRLGADAVTRVELVDSHCPERASRHVPVFAPVRRERATPLDADRPTMLWPRPELVEVLAMTPDGPLARVKRRGRMWRVLTCIGPERISHEWWRGQGATRDYFKVQDEQGRWWWIFHEMETSRWYVHGCWA